MYAVIKTGGKQYRVSPGDTLRVETLAVAEGDSVDFDEVLMVGNGDDVTIGTPTVSDAKVSGKVLAHRRAKKVKIIKFQRRKHHMKRMGHRQNYTELEIVSINGVTVSDSSANNAESSKSESKIDSGSAIPAAVEATTSADSTSAEAPKFLDAPNGEADDLKRILGIGPVLEENLNNMGIYHFSQVAEFTQTDTENINTYLNFPGRIERDDWISQARELMGGGEGRKLKYLDGPDGEPDDLKLISGVGPVISDRLNELGIYHFRQIAQFEQRDIDLVNDAISFPGRIERDEWIDQADNLAKGGEPR